MHALNVVVSETVDVDALVLIKVGTTHVPVETHRVVFGVGLSLNNIEPVGHKVRVLRAPLEQLYFLNRDVPAQIVHLSFWVTTVGLQS